MYMECPNRQQNIKKCNCSYGGCNTKGTCCECLHYHLSMRQLPACCFPNRVEKTYDRSFDRFAQLVEKKEI